MLAVPAGGLASSGGSGLAPGGSGLTPTGGNPSVQSGDAIVSTSANGVTLQTSSSAMLRDGLSLSGTAPRNLAGDAIEIERSGHETAWTWAPTASATIGANGAFATVWLTNHIGEFAIRAVISSPNVASGAAATAALTTTVYRPSLATQYGPGFYGRKTACGQKLRPTTIGVANRTLRCGEDVAVYYQGRTLVVPVIDRGPYANGADWDLTAATAAALGIGGTAEIGAVSLPAR
jgi:rare lipoprotein A